MKSYEPLEQWNLPDDWDHQGAKAVTPATVERGIFYAKLLDSTGVEFFACPTPGGDVGFEFDGTTDGCKQFMMITVPAPPEPISFYVDWEGDNPVPLVKVMNAIAAPVVAK